MRVLLVGVPGFHTQDEPMFPLGLGYLIATLKREGHDARGVYFIREEHMNRSLPLYVQGFKPELVGFSCNTFNRGTIRKAIQLTKSVDPKVKVVVGGVHATYYPSQMIDNYGADYVVLGEGESSLAELCMYMENSHFIDDVFGVAYKDSHVIVNPYRDPMRNLDLLPIPEHSFVGDLIRKSNMGYVITSRGCPVRCKFCSSGSFWGQSIRTHSPERVIKDIEDQISKFGVNRIRFHDNTFNFNMERVFEICNLLLEKDLKITWGVSCRVNPVSSEMIEIMVEAGCRNIAWGVESGSKIMLERMGKKITQDQIRYAYDLCEPYSRNGLLSTRTYTMVGFPGETEETVQETVSFLNTLSMTSGPECQVVYVLPGTKLWEDQRIIGDNYWVDTDEVLYVDKITGQDLGELYKWAKAIETSGKRILFDDKNHFWDGVLMGNIPEPVCPVFR